MIFYGYFRSSSAYRCRIAFNLKGLSPEFVSVHLRRNGGEQKTKTYRQLNPQGLVPTLSVDDMALSQSMAILEWLEERYPETSIFPTEPDLRAQARAFAQIIACDIHPLQNLRVLDYLRDKFALDQAGLDKWCQTWISDGLQACEKLAEKFDSGTSFCFGDYPTIADICLIPQMFSARRFGVDLSSFPRLCAIESACTALPAFALAQPRVQPDAEA